MKGPESPALGDKMRSWGRKSNARQQGLGGEREGPQRLVDMKFQALNCGYRRLELL